MISFLVPSIGRPSLHDTLRSILDQREPTDEVIVVGEGAAVQAIAEAHACRFVPCAPGHDWGHTERNVASPLAVGRYLAHIDDDDTYAPGARALMADAISTTPDRPVLFRMRYPNGVTLWREPALTFGNVGTPMMLIPNVPQKCGVWGAYNGGDFGFLETMGWSPSEIVWRPEVIALLGHNSEWAERQVALGACS